MTVVPHLRFLSLVVLLTCAPALAEVKVVSHPPTVKTRTFNPDTPPAEMPPLDQGEAAVCESKFACGVSVAVEISHTQGEKPIARVTGLEANLRLDVTIWLPTDATPKIRAHEHGHRQISEHFYALGEQVAKDLATKYVGRRLDIDSTDRSHTQPVIQRVATEFCQEYLGAIEVPSQKVQEEYDRLTDHGRNDLGEKEAIRQALKVAGAK